MAALCRAIVRLSARLAPRAARARWREEWLAEIDAARVTGWRLASRTAGAPLDALLARWTSADLPVRHGWRADVRHAVRALLKTPMQTVTMIGCLAVGAALMVSMFAITHALLGTGRLPGVDDRERVVRVFASTGPGRQFTLSWPQFLAADWSTPPPGVEAIGGELGWKFLVRAGEENRESKGAFVSGTFFPVFGTIPAAGRLIGPLDDRRDAAPVVVISHGFWMRHFAGDPAAIGSPLPIGTTTCTIIGVAPRGFLGTRVADLGQTPDARSELWLPMSLTSSWAGIPRNTRPVASGQPLPQSPNGTLRFSAGAAVDMVGPQMVARLAPGTDRQAAEAQLQAFVPQIAEAGGNRVPRSLGVEPFKVMGDVNDDEMAMVYAALFFVPFLVLLIGCANVAGLQRARASWRRHELAVRTSLGASRGRLARLLMVEVFVTASAASFAAWALTTWALRYTANILPFDAEADWRVFGFALGLPILITLLIGLAPSWKSAGVDVVSGLKAGSRDGQQGQWRLGRIAVVTQVGLSVMLVFAAVVLSRGVSRTLETGAAPADVVTAGFFFDDTGLTRDARRAAVQSLMQQARDIAGTGTVAFRSGRTAMASLGARRERFQPGDWIAARAATAAFFDLVDLHVVAGRVFRDGEANVMVVDEAFAARFGSAGRIVGQSFDVLTDGEAPIGTEGALPISRRVVGVVTNEKPSSPTDDEDDPTVYVPLETANLTQITILLRAADTVAAKRRLRAAAAAAYPTLVPRPLATLEEVRAQRYVSARWMAQALGAVGVLALILAVVGLFAMVSAAVAQRTREFGVRLALGASPAAVIAMVLREVMAVTSIGVVAGLVLSVPVAIFIRSAFLSDATLADPVGLAMGLLVMLAAIGVAAYVPARRAARVDPLLALRAD